MRSRSLASSLLLLAAAAALAGCGGGPSKRDDAVSRYDAGPRAAEAPVDTALAAAGRALFRSKSCTACHMYGKRLLGPDLKGVTHRRTAAWMEQQILHPDVMILEDPIARKLFHEYGLRMTNQGLKPEEARAIIEHFKKLDRDAEAHGELVK